MNARDKLIYQAKAKVLKALAHPTRLWMTEQLADGERCFCEFVDAVDVDFSTSSKHLPVGTERFDNAGMEALHLLGGDVKIVNDWRAGLISASARGGRSPLLLSTLSIITAAYDGLSASPPTGLIKSSPAHNTRTITAFPAGSYKKWRRGRDSNPRYREVHPLSRRARSTTPSPLRNKPVATQIGQAGTNTAL